MHLSVRFLVPFSIGTLLCCITGFGQAPQPGPSTFTRDNCIKVREGKGNEYAAFLRDTASKINKASIDAPGSNQIGYTVAVAVIPTGRTARCDYHILSFYSGFPEEAQSPEKVAGLMKAAGLTISREAMVAKRSELAMLVSSEVWVAQAVVGMPAKGAYARMNYDKVRPGRIQQWVSTQRDGWKPLAELAQKEHGMAWRALTLVMPGGEALPYNAMTVDLFPNWEAVGKGIPTRALWNKAHPNRDLAAHFDQQAQIRERPRVDLLRLVEVLRK